MVPCSGARCGARVAHAIACRGWDEPEAMPRDEDIPDMHLRDCYFSRHQLSLLAYHLYSQDGTSTAYPLNQIKRHPRHRSSPKPFLSFRNFPVPTFNTSIEGAMAIERYIPPCVRKPAHPFQPPHSTSPYKYKSIAAVPVESLLPDVTWRLDDLPSNKASA